MKTIEEIKEKFPNTTSVSFQKMAEWLASLPTMLLTDEDDPREIRYLKIWQEKKIDKELQSLIENKQISYTQTANLDTFYIKT